MAKVPQLTLSVEETSVLLGSGLRQTYEAVRRGELPAVKLGGRWYVKRAELLRMFGLEEA
ncbi:helix-turn-helix domain-containing protein [Microbacterium sp. SA39]|uniref:helix-turn-helix domain-containing protein n=1 Tax=Microbacterium sp. SA39 TaxID=1263625 RepID=UPI001364A237|nr:helix-turn-helix domain-containing protein [Microbacterium sp. SA39]